MSVKKGLGLVPKRAGWSVEFPAKGLKPKPFGKYLKISETGEDVDAET